MWFAHRVAEECLPRYSSKFSRRDFTLPQLFACLVLREHQRKSYRGVEALLCDSLHWCKQLGMTRVPDHNTLCRAFHLIMGSSEVTTRIMDRLWRWLNLNRAMGTTCAIDSTLYDAHHRSRHYERRCRHYQKNIGNIRRSKLARRMPKLALCVATCSHVIVDALSKTGMGSDAPDFLPLLRNSKRRWPELNLVLADAGYDSHENHQVARTKLRVQSLIKCGVGRRPVSDKPPASCYRRSMQKRLSGSQKKKPYAQRAQAETVNSMMKRNLGDHLRAKTPEGRRKEQLLRVMTHNIMLLLECPLRQVQVGRCSGRGMTFKREPLASFRVARRRQLAGKSTRMLMGLSPGQFVVKPQEVSF